MNPLHFAYTARRGAEDACPVSANLIANYLGKPGWYVRVLFMEFSSAFNTIQAHLLIKRLLDLDTDHILVLWIRQFLCDWPQSQPRWNIVWWADCEYWHSSGMCSLVHIVLYLYKYIEVVSTCILLTLVKFAENMALVARLQHFLQIDVLNSRFKESFLVLKVFFVLFF